MKLKLLAISLNVWLLVMGLTIIPKVSYRILEVECGGILRLSNLISLIYVKKLRPGDSCLKPHS